MNSKSLYSSVGLVAIAVALIFSVALISMLPSLRLDLTEDRLFSLSDGTRNIVANLQQPIELMFFYSDSATEDIPPDSRLWKQGPGIASGNSYRQQRQVVDERNRS